jgi:glycosyltransferase involved in cell wall biosynthesis
MTDLIVFGEDWGAHPSSTMHLVSHLPGENRILWANSIGLRRPKPTLSDLARAARKLAASLRPKPAKTPTPFPVIQPLVLPMATSRPARALNRALLARKLRPATRAAGLTKPALWLSLPSAIDAIGTIDHGPVIYYAGDDFGALAGVDHAICLAQEAELALRADLILAASPTIAARFPAAKTHILPHGVDLALFTTPTPAAPDLPSGKVAGYYGTLASWLDFPLIAATARLLPDWTFLFIGPIGADVTAEDLALLRAEPNITLLGPRPHASLPSYSRNWTAGLIPFRDNAQIRASNPLKLREYLAAGRPIVATHFPALTPYAAHIAVEATPDGFARALEASLTDTNTQARQSRVAAESWTARAATVATLIAALPR